MSRAIFGSTIEPRARRDSDKGIPTERWRRKVTGLKGHRAPRQRDRRNPVRPPDFLRLATTDAIAPDGGARRS